MVGVSVTPEMNVEGSIRIQPSQERLLLNERLERHDAPEHAAQEVGRRVSHVRNSEVIIPRNAF
jgi:hypothetical protein